MNSSKEEFKYFRRATTDPVADSVMYLFDVETKDTHNGLKADSLFIELKEIAKTTNDQEVRARAVYAESFLNRMKGNQKVAAELLQQALQLVDSVNYPYDWAEMALSKTETASENMPLRFVELEKCIRIFKEKGDSSYVCNGINRQAAYFEKLDDHEGALKYLGKALEWSKDSIPISIIHFNMALNNYKMGNYEETYKISHKLQESGNMSIFRKSMPDVGIWVELFNYWENNDPKHLQEAYYLTGKPRAATWFKQYIPALMTKHYLNTGDMDSVVKYSALMRNYMDSNLPHYDEVQRINAKVYEKEGKLDSADMANKDAERIEIMNQRVAQAAQLENQKADREIKSLMEQMENQDRSNRTIIILILIAVAGVTAVVAVAVKRTQRRHKESSEKTAAEMQEKIESAKRQLTVEKLKVAEKEQALDKVATEITEHRGDGPLNDRQLLAYIKSAQASDYDWQKFQLLFAELHPGFQEKLKEEYPTLTAGDIRMAGLVYLGLETKHMARLLSINPDSVKKNRQRLRGKIGLKPTDSLSEFLHAWAKRNGVANSAFLNN